MGKGITACGAFGLTHLVVGFFHQAGEISIRSTAHLGFGCRCFNFVLVFIIEIAVIVQIVIVCHIRLKCGQLPCQIIFVLIAQRRAVGQGRLAQRVG